MYSRGTERRRVKLPPGYDGSAFRHDTGEVRRPDTDMKIHGASPVPVERQPPVAQQPEREESRLPSPIAEEKAEKEPAVPSFLEGVLAGLGSEEWLLFLVILLLLADGSDAWDVILLLCLLLAVRGEEGGRTI